MRVNIKGITLIPGKQRKVAPEMYNKEKAKEKACH
jgi:hypothetical protein